MEKNMPKCANLIQVELEKCSKTTWGVCTRSAGKLNKARFPRYRSQILQESTRWTALAEIYTMHSFAPFSNLNFVVKNHQNFFAIELMNIH